MRQFTACFYFLVTLLFSQSVPAQNNGFANVSGAKSWKTVAELSDDEKVVLDFRTETPRSTEIPYLPAETYPFNAPYTAEELGYRSMEFPHVSRWSHAIADSFGTMTSGGYLNQGVTVGAILHTPEETGIVGHLKVPAGQSFFRMAFYSTSPAEQEGTQFLWILHRTDRENPTKLDSFAYSPALRRVRRLPQPRRGERFPGSAQSFDAVVGRDAWEFTWRFLGSDVLYKTIRFPTTRPIITLANPDGTFFDKASDQLKMMWDDYPFYREDGGVECYVVEAVTKEEWLPNYTASKIIYWLDKHYFYPLRIEEYDQDGELQVVEVRIARQDNPALKDKGYAALMSLYYDVPLDLLTYSVHDSHLVKAWSEKDKEVVFGPDFMRRDWLMYPLKTQTLVNSPAEFYLRPLLYPNKFPQERTIVVPPDVAARIHAQEQAGYLVFEDDFGVTEVKEP
jgi:hypothetical protein